MFTQLKKTFIPLQLISHQYPLFVYFNINCTFVYQCLQQHDPQVEGALLLPPADLGPLPLMGNAPMEDVQMKLRVPRH